MITEPMLARRSFSERPRPVGRRFIGLGQVPRPVGRRFVGMGETEPGMVEQIRTIYQGVSSLDPLIKLVGEHPWVTITMAMIAIMAGSAVGGYIGAGAKEEQQRKRRR